MQRMILRTRAFPPARIGSLPRRSSEGLPAGNRRNGGLGGLRWSAQPICTKTFAAKGERSDKQRSVIMNAQFHFIQPTVIAIALAIICVINIHPHAAEPAGKDTTRPFGINKRVAWTTSRIAGTPEPPSPYLLERRFPKLEFDKPVDICTAPGSDRWFVMEERGKIYSFPNRQDCEKADLFFNATNSIPGVQSTYGMIFHPGFETNRFVYVCYVLKENLPDGSRVSRFKVTTTETPQIDPSTETIIIAWLSGGHNGGSLQFGLDSYLYISTGDGVGPNPPDTLKTGQDNSDLLSSVLRIDVNRQDDGKNYRVPPDNPFINMPGNRPEIWAYGFRNPWRMSFDRKTGDLWLGDVGWELWELVYRVERGGNYGWSIVEGPQSIHPDWKRGPTPILPPVKAHPHSEAASITGGYVYRGTQFKDLIGAYVYGDWVSGKIWGLRSEGNKLTSIRELVDTAIQIIAFGEDHSGELSVVDYAGKIYGFIPNPAANRPGQFPRRLSETGLFDSAKHHLPAPGVTPFSINAEMWADHALAERFVALPNHSTIQTGATNVWLYQSKNEWRYPTNAVLAKTLFLEMESGKPETLRRVETQVLHYDGLDWRAYSYRWNEDQTDAALVDADGAEQTLQVKDPDAPGGRRSQNWRFHSRTECLRCHNPWVNFALAFTGPQLNREVQYQANHPVSASLPLQTKPSRWPSNPIVTDNQLRTFSHLGFFDQPLDERAKPKLVDPYSDDPKAGLNERARSWLHVNCAHCHREGAGGSVASLFDYDRKLADMNSVSRAPGQGALGIHGANVVAPNDPCRSVLYYRILTTGQGRMPLIGSRHVDVRGANLIHDWIEQLPEESSEKKPGDDAAAKLRARNGEALKRISGAHWPRERVMEAIDRMLESPNGALGLAAELNRRGGSPAALAELAFVGKSLEERLANHASFQVRDLFERFLPEEKRMKKLGASFNATSILSINGDVANGRKTFFHEGTQCVQCHRLDGQGRDVGPDLSRIGAKFSRAELLDHLVNPSKVIDPAFVNYAAEMKDGETFTGLLLQRSADEVVLKDANAQQIRLRADRVKTLQPQKLSAMPEGLLQNLTASAVADLLEFLGSLQ